MPPEKEVLKYELDITDAEQKSARLIELSQKINEASARGEDTSDLEQQLGREVAALGAVSSAQTKTGAATGDLLKKKEQLGSVVRILGGQFSGLLGDAGGVLELFTSMGATAGPLAAALAGITVAIKAWSGLNEELRRTEELLKRIDLARSRFGGEQAAAFDTISDSLKGAGGFSGPNAEAAFNLFREALAGGVPESAAAGLAGPAFAAGLSAEDIGLLAAAGKSPATPKEAQDDIAAIRKDPAVRDEVAAAAARSAGSRAGQQSRLAADLIDRQFKDDPRFGERLAGVSQDAILHERAVALGLIKPDAPLDRIDELRAEIPRLQAERKRQLQLADEAGPLSGAALRLRAIGKRLQALRPLTEASAGLRDIGILDTTGPVSVRRYDDYDGPDPEAAGPRGFSERALRALQPQGPQSPPAPPRIGDFTDPNAIVGPPAPTSQPVVHNHIRIGTLNARPGRGWLRRGGRAGFGTNSFNVADGGSA